MNEEEEKVPIETRTNWHHLEYCGWESIYLDAIGYGDIPSEPGVYAIVYEVEKPALYVGQSGNLKQRLRKNHPKISHIVSLWENAILGSHNKGNVESEILIFWKTISLPYYNGSEERTLIWCEAIAIGLLCPILQDKVNDIDNQAWAPGMNFYE
jgi:hypothetical protein